MKSPILHLMSWLCASLALPLPAQVQQAWVHRYAASNSTANRPVAIVLDQGGNVVVGGNGFAANGTASYVVMKLASAGNQQWASLYATTDADIVGVRAMAMDVDGNTYLTGGSETVKYDPYGERKWAAPYGGRSLAVGSNQFLYVVGFRSDDFSIIKLAPGGTNVWLKTYDLIGRSDIAQKVVVAGDAVYVAGKVQWACDRFGCYERFGIVKYNEQGEQQWALNFPNDAVQYYSGVQNQTEVFGLAVDLNGTLRLAGVLPGSIGKLFDIAKVSPVGALSWENNLYAGPEGLTSMAVDNAGNTFVTGKRVKVYPSHITYQTFKADKDGNTIWSAQYFGPTEGYHQAKAIALDSAGNVYVTGQSPSPGTANDYATIKYSPTGQELWVQRYDGPAHGDDVATAIAVAADGSVYVTGWSTTSSNLIEITTIKYTQPATLTVETNRTVSLQFPGTPGATNRVQATTDFLGWLDLGFTVADTNGLIRFVDTNAPAHPFRFYRTVAP